MGAYQVPNRLSIHVDTLISIPCFSTPSSPSGRDEGSLKTMKNRNQAFVQLNVELKIRLGNRYHGGWIQFVEIGVALIGIAVHLLALIHY